MSMNPNESYLAKLENKLRTEFLSDQEIEDIQTEIENLKLQIQESTPAVQAKQDEQVKIIAEAIKKENKPKRSIYDIVKAKQEGFKEGKASIDNVSREIYLISEVYDATYKKARSETLEEVKGMLEKMRIDGHAGDATCESDPCEECAYNNALSDSIMAVEELRKT